MTTFYYLFQWHIVKTPPSPKNRCATHFWATSSLLSCRRRPVWTLSLVVMQPICGGVKGMGGIHSLPYHYMSISSHFYNPTRVIISVETAHFNAVMVHGGPLAYSMVYHHCVYPTCWYRQEFNVPLSFFREYSTWWYIEHLNYLWLFSFS